MKKHDGDAINAFQRQSKAARRIGVDKKCICGESRPLALIAGSNPTVCASCQRETRGEPFYDAHHPAGKANNRTTVTIWVNDHRAALTDAQYDWPEATWRNSSGSPALAGAASIRGYWETTEYLADRLLLENALFLEALENFLVKRLGPNWWRGTELEPFAPKRKSGREVKRGR